MSKNKTFKVKRSKGRLYKKKKSAGRKVLEVILLVVIAGGLGFLGYSLAGPLISYIQEGGESVTTPWEPPESSTPEESESSDTSDSESADTTTQPLTDNSGSYLLPVTALTNQGALTQALNTAQGSGCSGRIVPVKNGEGNLLYSSQLDGIKGTDLVTGTMSAGQIVGVIKGRGFTSIKALLPTLYDRTTPLYVEDTGYRFADDSYGWLDAAAENGGKPWVDPFRTGTKQYYSALAGELIKAGFDEILMSELRFPAFEVYDESILEARNFMPTRYTALTTLYRSTGSAASNKAAVAINIADVLEGYGQSFGSTAEILSDKSFTGTVYLMIRLTDFGTRLATGENASIMLPADPVQKVQALVSKAMEYIGTNVTVVPVIESAGLSAEALGKCYAQLAAE